jgi:ketosteroid isomerase-like protein
MKNHFKTLVKCGTILILLFIIHACNLQPNKDKAADWKQEVIKTEGDFAAMAAKEGIGHAFVFYAADSAVLMRSNRLIIGKNAITKAYGNLNSDSLRLSWKPDFVEVSESGDLAYTYGKYVMSVMDSLGQFKLDTGIFHTVWKRQADGQWRFVWD